MENQIKVDLKPENKSPADIIGKITDTINVLRDIQFKTTKTNIDTARSTSFLSNITDVLKSIKTGIDKLKRKKIDFPEDSSECEVYLSSEYIEQLESEIKKHQENFAINAPVTKDTLKLFKLDLIWKWIRGMWNTLNRYVPLLATLSNMLTSALSIILTALLLPFLPEILNVLTWLLDRSIAFFDWMEKNQEKVKETAGAAGGIGLDLAALFPKALAGLATKIYEAIVPESLRTAISKIATWISEKFGLSAAFEKLSIWLGEKGLSGVISKAVGTILGIVNPLIWVNLGASILDIISTWALGVENPLTKLIRIFENLSDVVGISISAFRDIASLFGLGKGGNIGEKLDEFWSNIKDILPSVPIALADGGIVTSPTAALIGEAGPEAVIPLSKYKQGITITVNGILDERKFREIIQSVVNQSMQKNYSVRGGMF